MAQDTPVGNGGDGIVLDRLIPGIDGLAAPAALRSKKPIPVLMLTARGSVGDRVRGLNGGADDCLVKPFAFSELVARLQALVRVVVVNHGGRPLAQSGEGTTTVGLLLPTR